MKAGSGGNSDAKQFPVGRMLETASQMMANANQSLAEHEQAWTRIQNYIDSFPGFMQGPVRAVLEAYEKRVRASYQWQIDCATSLAMQAEAAETTDTNIAQSFTGYDNTDTGGGGR